MKSINPLPCFALVTLINIASTHTAPAAIYKESGGIVVVEAEHFDRRTTDAGGRHWHIVPDDDGTDALADIGDPPFLNARAGKYIQSLPNTGANKNSPDLVGTDPIVEYNVQINTTGEYRLWIRWSGYDGSSDSLYAQLVGAATPGWYRYSDGANPDDADFATKGNGIGWDGIAAPDEISGGGAEIPAVYTIGTAATYTIRLSQREAGSAVDALLFQLSSLPDPTDPGPPESSQAGTFISIIQEPRDITVGTNQAVTFTISATGSSPPSFQWQRAPARSTTFTNIPGATGTNITVGPTVTGESGSQFRAVLTIPGLTNITRVATLTVDVVPLDIFRAFGSPTFDLVTVVFSEPVSPNAATNPANFSISGLTVSSATLAAGGTRVVLATSRQTTNATHTITVRNLRDVVGNQLVPDPATVTFNTFVFSSGGALHKFWENITPNNIDALETDPRFPDNPTSVTIESSFEYPPNGGNEAGSNYGNQLIALLRPAVTGDYVFYVSGDDPVELYLSTDEQPVNKTLIAQEPTWNNARQWLVTSRRDPTAPENRSAPITLQANKFYYFEALHTEGGGGDSMGATWQLPGAPEPANGSPPIQGQFLWTFRDPNASSTATISLSSPTEGATFPAGGSVTITATTADTNGPVRSVEFFANGAKIGESTSAPFSITWSNLITGRFTLTARALDRRGFQVTSGGVLIIVGNPPPEVLFITGATMTPSDIEMTNRLGSMGFIVTQLAGPATLTSQANGKILIVDSSTVGSGDVNTKFRNVTVPVLSNEQALQDDYLFSGNTDGTDRGTIGGQTELVIAIASHPIAAGLTGLVTVANSPASFTWGVPASSASIIATLAPPEDTTRAAIYAFERDATLFDGVTKAPARRVHFFLDNNTFEFTTDAGKKLFDAAVHWAIGTSGGGGEKPQMSITRSGPNVIISWTQTGTLQVADSVPGSWTDIPAATSPHTVSTASSTKFYRVRR